MQRAHLEERVLSRWRCLGRGRNPFRLSNPFRPGMNLSILPMISPPAPFQPEFRPLRQKRHSAFSWGVLLSVFAVALLWCATLALEPAVAGQRNEPDQRGRIRTEVSLVSVLASVLDKNGHPAMDLTADQFELYEEGRKQKIEVIEPETQQPLDLTLMIDSSLSEIKELEFEANAASRFIQKLVRQIGRASCRE